LKQLKNSSADKWQDSKQAPKRPLPILEKAFQDALARFQGGDNRTNPKAGKLELVPDEPAGGKIVLILQTGSSYPGPQRVPLRIQVQPVLHE